VTRRKISDLVLLDCDCLPFKGHSALADGHADGSSVVGLQLVRRGSERFYERERGGTSHAGDVKLWASWEPVDIEVLERFAKRTVVFPLERMLAVCPRLSTDNVLPPLRNDGATRLLVRYVDAIASELPYLDAATAAVAADTALELLRATVEPGMPTTRDARRMAMLTEIRRYVRTHLQDPLLDPGSIARAHAMSVRVLHALFKDSDESVAGMIRRQRLARCWDDLERPTGGAVTEIAYRWGFRDATHFSRAFKREFGISPSEARRAALNKE
jgi:AraC-like DNA-binding protein